MRGTRLLSMRWWLPVAFALIAAVTALAVAQVFQAQTRSALRGKAEELAAGSAVGAAARIAEAPTLAEARARVVDQARRRRVALFLFDADGTLLSDELSQGVRWTSVENRGELLSAVVDGRRSVLSLDDGRLVTVALPLRGGSAASLVEVAARPDLVEASSIVETRIWVAAGWATLIGALTGVFVSLLITLRVRRIGAAAALIAEGEFESELRPRFPDELGQLASAVDTMRLKLRGSFGQLASERDQLRTLIEQLQEGVIGVREDLTVVVANARASALLGEEVVEGRPLGNPWPAADLEALARRLFEATSEVESLQVASGPEHSFAVTGVPSASSGTAVIVVTDVTERQRRERAEREFVANAAHELRTPVAAIASAVEVLQLGAKEQPVERDRFLALIERQTTRLGRLGDVLLTLARAQSRAESIRLEPVDVPQVLRELATDLDLPESALEIDEAAVALAHADLLRQAVENLVANARKYASAEGLVVSVRPRRGTVVIEVRDRGPGLTPEQAERAVERFFRSGDRGSDGFGLGLSIAREVARALGGHLEIESGYGEGTTARITLRRAPTPGTGNASGRTRRGAVRSPGGGGR